MFSQMQKERITKLRQEIRDNEELARSQTALRRRSEQQLRDRQGFQEKLVEFHKPVIDRMSEQEVARKQETQALQAALQEAMHSLDSSNLPAITEEDLGIQSMFHQVDLNKDLDESFLREQGLELPSALIGKTNDQLDDILKHTSTLNQKLGGHKGSIQRSVKAGDESKRGQLEMLDYQISQIKMYRKAVKTLHAGSDYMYGEGVDKVNLLYTLTESLGTPTQKLHNQIVDVLDRLLIEGTVTEDYVKRYYSLYKS